MKIWKSLAIVALLFSQSAIAEKTLVTLIDAVETSPSTIILPASVNGMMTYKSCPGECDREYERARLTADTTFKVGGKRVKFEDFRIAFDRIKRDDDAFAGLSVDLQKKTVIEINIVG